MNPKPTAFDQFKASPSPATAVALAIEDHRAGKLTDWPFVDELRKAEAQVAAYSKLVAAARGEYPGQPSFEQWAQEKFEDGLVHTKEVYHAEMRYALLRELGEFK